MQLYLYLFNDYVFLPIASDQEEFRMNKQNLHSAVHALGNEDLRILGKTIQQHLGVSVASIAADLQLSRQALTRYFAKKHAGLRHPAQLAQWIAQRLETSPRLLENPSVKSILPGEYTINTKLALLDQYLLTAEDLEILLQIVRNSGQPLDLRNVPVILNKKPP